MMADFSKSFEVKSQCGSLKDEISLIRSKLFFEVFPDLIVHLRIFSSLASCWEIRYLFHHYLHRDMVGREVDSLRMAVPVFESLGK